MTVNADGSPTQIVGDQNDMHVFNGLLDTGASRTCMSVREVSNVSLVLTGKIQILRVTGTKLINEYRFGIGFLIAKAPQPTAEITSQWEMMPIHGSFFDGSGSGFDVLIGRDFLCQGIITMSFDDHVTFSR